MAAAMKWRVAPRRARVAIVPRPGPGHWLRVLLATLRQAVADLELARDPTRGPRPLDTSTLHTYTEEEPNALTANEVRGFLAKARETYPQHFALFALGFATGRRPAELRPLRRKGRRRTSSGARACCSCGDRRRAVR
jgi:integrase